MARCDRQAPRQACQGLGAHAGTSRASSLGQVQRPGWAGGQREAKTGPKWHLRRLGVKWGVGALNGPFRPPDHQASMPRTWRACRYLRGIRPAPGAASLHGWGPNTTENRAKTAHVAAKGKVVCGCAERPLPTARPPGKRAKGLAPMQIPPGHPAWPSCSVPAGLGAAQRPKQS